MVSDDTTLKKEARSELLTLIFMPKTSANAKAVLANRIMAMKCWNSSLRSRDIGLRTKAISNRVKLHPESTMKKVTTIWE